MVTGLRKSESTIAFNRIQLLAEQGRLDTYYNRNLQMLSHFSQLDNTGKPIFLRVTKNAFISFISNVEISKVAESNKVFYTTVRKHLGRYKLPLRVKELRSYNNTFLRKNGLMAELVDLLAGRVKRQVFLRHYLKVEDLKQLSKQVLSVTAKIENGLLS